jgi:urate oxidase
MTFVLSQSNYGKSAIRLVKVVRDEGRHELSDVTVDVMLEGDFGAAHDEGDNSALIATDTMRNAVYVLAAKHDVSELESFGRALVEHFVVAGPTVQRAQVRLVAHPWARLGEHEHAFQRGAGGDRIAVVSGDGHSNRIEAGVEGLEVLRTSGSGWSGFVRDELTTLPETDDRILATAVSARWSYAEGGIDYGASWQAARDAILEAFGDHYSSPCGAWAAPCSRPSTRSTACASLSPTVTTCSTTCRASAWRTPTRSSRRRPSPTG